VQGLRLRDITTDLDARWQRGALGRVEQERQVIVTVGGSELHYDLLVLALGARPQREWQAKGVLTYRDATRTRFPCPSRFDLGATDGRRLLGELADLSPR
jgi:hypothetical protein